MLPKRPSDRPVKVDFGPPQGQIRPGDTLTSALSLEASTLTELQPVNGLSSTTLYIPRLALLVPGCSLRARLPTLPLLSRGMVRRVVMVSPVT